MAKTRTSSSGAGLVWLLWLAVALGAVGYFVWNSDWFHTLMARFQLL